MAVVIQGRPYRAALQGAGNARRYLVVTEFNGAVTEDGEVGKVVQVQKQE